MAKKIVYKDSYSFLQELLVTHLHSKQNIDLLILLPFLRPILLYEEKL